VLTDCSPIPWRTAQCLKFVAEKKTKQEYIQIRTFSSMEASAGCGLLLKASS
jgi:hypothetical protein